MNFPVLAVHMPDGWSCNMSTPQFIRVDQTCNVSIDRKSRQELLLELLFLKTFNAHGKRMVEQLLFAPRAVRGKSGRHVWNSSCEMPVLREHCRTSIAVNLCSQDGLHSAGQTREPTCTYRPQSHDSSGSCRGNLEPMPAYSMWQKMKARRG